MRKFFKKAVATVAALAMAVAGLVVAPKLVKAGDTTKLVVYLSGFDNVGKVYLDTQSQQSGPERAGNITSTATKSTLLTWGREEYEFTKVADGKYEIELTGTCEPNTWINLQIIVTPITGDTQLFGGKFSLSNYPTAGEKYIQTLDFNNKDVIYFSINENTAQWQEIGYSLTDPNAQQQETTTAAENETTTAAANETTTAANETTTAAENPTTTAADNKATTAADNKTTTAADNKTTTAAADNTTTVADNGGAGAGEAESTTGAGGSSTDVGASDSSVVIFAVLAAVAIMGAAMVFVKKKSQEA